MRKRAFPNIEKLGLSVFEKENELGQRVYILDAREVEDKLASAKVVYGIPGYADWSDYSHTQNGITPSVQALLIGITPIKKKSKAEAAVDLLERLGGMTGIFNVAWVKDDIKTILEMEE